MNKKAIFRRSLPRMGLILVLLLLIGFMALGPTMATPAQAGNSVTYNLYATDTFIALADGTIVYNYGFVGGRQGVPLTFQNSMKAPVNPGGKTTIATGAPAPTGGPVTAAETPLLGNAQFPAPLITAAKGDVVEIRLKNLGTTNKGSPNDPHSIHLHGMDVDAANDGVPETSVGAVPANLAVPGAGNVVVYMFSPTNPGTYFYHCHQEADIHVQMGMYGALVVYNAGEQGAISGPGSPGSLFGWSYNKDVVLLLSEIDTRQHTSEQIGFVGGGAVFNPVNFQPQYWFINGLSFPNTIHASAVGGAGAFNWTNWIAAHNGYDPLITGSTGAQDKVLIRMINMGFETQPMHMHGFHGKIIGKDQRAWTWANNPGTPWGQGMEINTLTIGSGEEYDWLVNFGLQPVTSTYQPGTQSRYTVANNLPASNTTTDPAIPVPGVPGATYIGGPTVSGAVGISLTSQLFPFHNHDDYKATNNGVYPGGMFTMLIPLP